ncbi:hypothetical protein M9H77_33552 [Catharanthus roseus]|uniref:Uncharacterized protein n=1 Tax=Catharanthus roseus TaxID=4058 RepID=A0ACB9ZKV0_CATRO|nr:hypothetical protein M9H77_33552 [Catharanthus roseus]
MRSTLYYVGCDEENYQPHFLDSCSLCRRPLAHNHDIFMYRGNTPFCSQECRQEQIEIDEANERRWKVSSSSSTKRSNTKNRSNTTSDSRKESDHTNKPVRTGAVAVA